MNTVFIDAYPRTKDDYPSLMPLPSPSSSFQQLCDYVKIGVTSFNRDFTRLYLMPVHTPDEFTPAQGRPMALNLLPLLQGRRVVLLGRLVAEAFDIKSPGYEYFQWFDHPEWVQSSGIFSVIPHPLAPYYKHAETSVIELQNFMGQVMAYDRIDEETNV